MSELFDDDESEPFARVAVWLLLVIVVTVLLALWVGPSEGAEVSYRNAGGRILNATPTPIGTEAGRVDLYIHNDADSTDDIVCGYNAATMSFTPGPSSGDKLNPGEGKHMCIFADKRVFCMTLGQANVFFDESRMVTPTPTP